MAKLYLKSEQRILKELVLPETTVTIGRAADNTLVIDDLAVSGHHCRIRWDLDHHVIEDTDSTNGLYRNGEHIFVAPLNHNDQVLIGKHFLIYEKSGRAEALGETLTYADDSSSFVTPFPDATPEPMAAAVAPAVVPQREKVGVLTPLSSKAEAASYVLSSKLTVIGKSEMASVRLKGWLAPNVAANLVRRENRYIIAPADSSVKIMVNGQSVSGPHELQNGDTIDVAGFKFSFAYQD